MIICSSSNTIVKPVYLLMDASLKHYALQIYRRIQGLLLHLPDFDGSDIERERAGGRKDEASSDNGLLGKGVVARWDALNPAYYFSRYRRFMSDAIRKTINYVVRSAVLASSMSSIDGDMSGVRA